MASNVTAKDKKQIKVLGIIVAALLVVLVVVLAIPAPKKQYTQEQMAALAVKKTKVVKRSYKIRVQGGHKSGEPPSMGCPPLYYLPLPLPSLWVPK